MEKPESILSLREFEKLKRLAATRKIGYRLTHLYARYLEYCPNAVKKETVDELVKGGLPEKEAIGAVLAALFSLDTENSAEDRTLYRDFILPSVRILDARDYEDDLYRKTVKIDFAKEGRITCKNETYPPYRGMICNEMFTFPDGREIPPLGFFKTPFTFPAVLEDGNEWMTLSPVDVDTCQNAIRDAHGDVVTFGLGLGYFAFMAARKPEVSRVTVIEKNPDVIALFKKHLLPQFPCRDKIRVIEADAFAYAGGDMKNERYDYAFVDTWRDASDGLPMYQKMKKCEKYHETTEFSYWIESFILSRLRAAVFDSIFLSEKAANHAAEGATGTFSQVLGKLSDDALRRLAISSEKEFLLP